MAQHAAPLLSFNQHPVGVFKAQDQAVQEPGRLGAVDHAVIEGQRERERSAGDDLAVLHHGPVRDLSDPQDRRLRIVDDRRAVDSADDAVVGDRERAPLELVQLDLPAGRLLAQLVHRLGQF